jgi:hypothetical protein
METKNVNFRDQIREIVRKSGSMSQETLANRTDELMECATNYFFDFNMPSSLRFGGCTRVEGEDILMFDWFSVATESICPKCHHISHKPDSNYLRAEMIQDCPGYNGCQIWHQIWRKQFKCTNDPCRKVQFLETFGGLVCRRWGRMTVRLVQMLVGLAKGRSLEVAGKNVRALGIAVSNKTLSRIKKRVASAIIIDNLVTHAGDVVNLGMDDINLRKGDSSSSCTVFVNLDTHKILAIAEGTTGLAAYNVLKMFPNVKIVSRDRGTAMASAADKIGAIQVADGFHVTQNLNVALKKVLKGTLPIGINVPIGNAWVKNSNIGEQEFPSSLPEDDIANRVRFAQLTPRQEIKYRNAMAIFERTNSGQHAAEIAAILNLPVDEVRKIRDKMANIIKEVEDKMDEFLKNPLARVKKYESVGNSPQPSSRSVVAPYGDTVISMHKEGITFRKIHEAICKEGFTGCASTVDNYIIKYTRENSLGKGIFPAQVRCGRLLKLEMKRPERIDVQFLSTDWIYSRILDLIKKSRSKKVDDKSQKKVEPEKSLNWPLPDLSYEINLVLFSKMLAEPEDPESLEAKEAKEAWKKANMLKNQAFGKVQLTRPEIGKAIQFGMDFYQFYDSHDQDLLDAFIVKYEEDPCELYATFAKGLKKDLEAIRNMLRYPDISNGVVEGLNNFIKKVKRVSYGRAKLPLLLAQVLV